MDMIEFGLETEVLKILNDPLMDKHFRERALYELRSRFKWPRDSTVPVP